MRNCRVGVNTSTKRDALVGIVLVMMGLLCVGIVSAASGPESTNNSPALADAQIIEVLQRVAHHQYHPITDGEYPTVTNIAEARAAKAPTGLVWSGPWGNTLYGLERFADVTHDQEAAEFVADHNRALSKYYGWIARLPITTHLQLRQVVSNLDVVAIKDLLSVGSLENCGPMSVSLIDAIVQRRMQSTNGQTTVAARSADWIANKHERLADGTLWRSNTLGGIVSAEDLASACPFLTRFAMFGRREDHLLDAANQIVRQAALEQDTNGLWAAGYFITDKKSATAKTCRANGSALFAAVEVLTLMQESETNRANVLAILTNQVAALKPLQTSSGLWRQVIDNTNAWEETSGSAMIAYGLARAANRGWIDASYLDLARKAFDGIRRQVTTNGVIPGVCESMELQRDVEYYLKRSRPEDDPQGPGFVLLGGSEILAARKK